MTRFGRLFRRNYGDVKIPAQKLPERKFEVSSIKYKHPERQVSLDAAIKRHQENLKKAQKEVKTETKMENTRREKLNKFIQGTRKVIEVLQEEERRPRKRRGRRRKRK